MAHFLEVEAQSRGQIAINVFAVTWSLQGPFPGLPPGECPGPVSRPRGPPCCHTPSSGMSGKAVSPADPGQVPLPATHCVASGKSVPSTPSLLPGSGSRSCNSLGICSRPRAYVSSPGLCLQPSNRPARLGLFHPCLWLEKQRHREARCLAQGHTAGRWGQSSKAQCSDHHTTLPACLDGCVPISTQGWVLEEGASPSLSCPSPPLVCVKKATETGEGSSSVPPPGGPWAQPGWSHPQPLVSPQEAPCGVHCRVCLKLVWSACPSPAPSLPTPLLATS